MKYWEAFKMIENGGKCRPLSHKNVDFWISFCPKYGVMLAHNGLLAEGTTFPLHLDTLRFTDWVVVKGDVVYSEYRAKDSIT